MAGRSLYWVKIKVNKHVLPFFREKLAHKVSTADVSWRSLPSARVKARATGKSTANSPCCGAHTGSASRLRCIYRMPPIHMLEERNVRQGFFEQAEFEKLLAKLPDYLRAPMTFAHYTGWRWRSEIMTLTWSQIDLEAGTVRLLPGTTKNGEGRVIMLFSPLRELLEAQWAEHLALSAACPLVFHRNGEPIKKRPPRLGDRVQGGRHDGQDPS